MRKFAILCAGACGLLALFLVLGPAHGAFIDENVKKSILKMAAALEKGDAAAAKSEAAAIMKKVEADDGQPEPVESGGGGASHGI